MEEALLRILRDAQMTNEDGAPLTDFVARWWDRKDFTSVSRHSLHEMLVAAYTAGGASMAERVLRETQDAKRASAG